MTCTAGSHLTCCLIPSKAVLVTISMEKVAYSKTQVQLVISCCCFLPSPTHFQLSLSPLNFEILARSGPKVADLGAPGPTESQGTMIHPTSAFFPFLFSTRPFSHGKPESSGFPYLSFSHCGLLWGWLCSGESKLGFLQVCHLVGSSTLTTRKKKSEYLTKYKKVRRKKKGKRSVFSYRFQKANCDPLWQWWMYFFTRNYYEQIVMQVVLRFGSRK